MKFLILNGPNLNMLGVRDKKHYGSFTLKDLENKILDFCKEKYDIEFFQSNSEGAIIDKLHLTNADCVILNAGAYTHYSYAIRDAIECITPAVIEVHISKISERENFRKISVIKDVCIHSIEGEGMDSYTQAIRYYIDKNSYAKNYGKN